MMQFWDEMHLWEALQSPLIYYFSCFIKMSFEKSRLLTWVSKFVESSTYYMWVFIRDIRPMNEAMNQIAFNFTVDAGHYII